MNSYLIIFTCSCLFVILSGVCLWALFSSERNTLEGAELHGVKPSAMLYHLKAKIFQYSAVGAALLIIAILIIAGMEVIGV